VSDDLLLVPIRLELPRNPAILGPNGELRGEDPKAKRKEKQNYWMLREKLIDSKTNADLVEFLNECGYACVNEKGLITRPWKLEYLSANLVKYLFELKDLLMKWMPLGPSSWRKLEGRFSKSLLEYVCLGTGRHHSLHAAFGWSRDGAPVVTVFAHDEIEAIILTVHIDHLRRVRFKSCARPDCRKPFHLTSRHRRLYCGRYCGHLVAVRNSYRKKVKKNSGH
jgi:hypothetical protein